MKKIALLLNVLLVATICVAQKQTYKFDFSSDKKVKEGYLKVTPQTLFNNEQGYGYDLPAYSSKRIAYCDSDSDCNIIHISHKYGRQLF